MLPRASEPEGSKAEGRSLGLMHGWLTDASVRSNARTPSHRRGGEVFGSARATHGVSSLARSHAWLGFALLENASLSVARRVAKDAQARLITVGQTQVVLVLEPVQCGGDRRPAFVDLNPSPGPVAESRAADVETA